MKSQNHRLPENDCDAITELIADYAFGLTDADETRLVEDGLPHCREAQQQLAEYRQLQGEMRGATPQIAPPSALRDKLLAATAPVATTPPVAAKQPAPAAPKIIPMPPQPKPASRLHPAWLAATAAFALLLVTNIYWFSRMDTSPESQVAAFTLNSTAGLRWVRMPAEEPLAGNVFLMWNESSETGLMYASGLPELNEGRVYELWLTRDGKRTSVGTFNVNNTGEAALIFNGEVELDQYAWAWVTEELASGEPQPAEIVVASGEL